MAKKSKYESVWTEAMSRRVSNLFDAGGSIAEVSRMMGISRSTFHAWITGTDALKLWNRGMLIGTSRSTAAIKGVQQNHSDPSNANANLVK